MSLAPAHTPFVTLEEYHRLEAKAERRHEYDHGKIIEMAGGSLSHSRIIVNVGREISIRLKGKRCEVLDSNFRIGFPSRTYTHYPDAMIVCDEPALDPRDETKQTLTNPTAIVEVLSPSTAGFDRGEKFDRYRTLETFREYVVIFQDRPEILVYFRQPDGTWLFSPFAGPEAVARLRSIEIDLPLADVYDRVRFEPPDAEGIPDEIGRGE